MNHFITIVIKLFDVVSVYNLLDGLFCLAFQLLNTFGNLKLNDKRCFPACHRRNKQITSSMWFPSVFPRSLPQRLPRHSPRLPETIWYGLFVLLFGQTMKELFCGKYISLPRLISPLVSSLAILINRRTMLFELVFAQ